MSRIQKTAQRGKTRQDHNPAPAEPESRIADIDLKKEKAGIDFTVNTWTVKMAAAWAGIPERTLYRLLREGVLPCIAMGDLQQQKLPTARSGKRVRRCYRFVIPRVAFMRAWEGISEARSLRQTA